MEDGHEQINYRNLFMRFMKLRKLKLIRFLFSLRIEFEFRTSLFLLVLEEDAYDIAVLLH